MGLGACYGYAIWIGHGSRRYRLPRHREIVRAIAQRNRDNLKKFRLRFHNAPFYPGHRLFLVA